MLEVDIDFVKTTDLHFHDFSEVAIFIFFCVFTHVASQQTSAIMDLVTILSFYYEEQQFYLICKKSVFLVMQQD